MWYKNSYHSFLPVGVLVMQAIGEYMKSSLTEFGMINFPFMGMRVNPRESYGTNWAFIATEKAMMIALFEMNYECAVTSYYSLFIATLHQ